MANKYSLKLIFARKKFECGWCGKNKAKGMPYRWVDGSKSCHDCNLKYDYTRYVKDDEMGVEWDSRCARE